MHEDLLGYLLGALEPDEMQRVSRWLREDPEAREQLAELERMLRPLEEEYVPVEPPPTDLVARTLAMLPDSPPGEPVGSGHGVRDGDRASVGDSTHSGDRSSGQVELADSIYSLTPMHAAADVTRGGSAGWLDWVGGAVAAAVVLGLLLPALAQGRFESRKIACQDQLRRLGTALTQFVTRSPSERLPAVSESGPEAFSGVYAVRLSDLGLLEDPAVRWCPSLDSPDQREATLTNLGEIVTVDSLHRASVDQLQQIQRYAGGHYAYNLGVVEDERLASPKFEARSSFAVMSDAPLIGNAGMSQVAGAEELGDWLGHGGIGINVLFEDGCVRFLSLESLDSMPDHPLLNHRGEVEAGVNIDDAALAPSWRPPFLDVPQR